MEETRQKGRSCSRILLAQGLIISQQGVVIFFFPNPTSSKMCNSYPCWEDWLGALWEQTGYYQPESALSTAGQAFSYSFPGEKIFVNHTITVQPLTDAQSPTSSFRHSIKNYSSLKHFMFFKYHLGEKKKVIYWNFSTHTRKVFLFGGFGFWGFLGGFFCLSF